MMSVNANSDQDNKSYLKVVRIYSAIKEGFHETEIEKILQTDGDINYRTPEGLPNLLHEVINRFCRNNFINLLLDHGADFTFKDKQGRTVVHKAIHEKSSGLYRRIIQDEDVDLILAAHVKFENPSNPRDDNGISHFHAACMTNNAEVVEFFLRNGVDVDQAVNADSSIFPSYTALELAVKYTSPDVVELLLKHGANVHTKNTDGLSPLHSIVQRKIAKRELVDEPRFVQTLNVLIKFAIDSGMNNDEFGFCKLHMACFLGDELLVENILDQVTNINRCVNSDSPICAGYTALHFAAFSNVEIFKLLLQNGANIEAQNTKGQTPFDLCLQNYSATDVHSIISSRKEWENITLSDNETKLLTVILAMEHINEYRSFLDLPRHFNVTNGYIPFNSPLWPGCTLLHLAVIFAKKILDPKVAYFAHDDINFIEVLLNRERDVTVADAEGSTALHLAFYMQKRGVIRYLLKYHDTRNLNPIDKNNLSHLHIACASDQLFKFSLSNHENINAPVNSKFDWYDSRRYSGKWGTRHFSICPGSTALHIAVAFGNYGGKLIEHGADVYARDANGLTPVHRLLTCRHEESSWRAAECLLKAGSSRNVTTNCGLSHLHVACYFGHLGAVEQLLKAGADSRLPVTCEFDSRMKDYDECFCASHGNHRQPWSFMAEYSNYTPLEFLWHPHCMSEEYGDKIFWKISFMLIKRDADVFAKNDKGVSMLRKLMRKIKSHGSSCLYAMLSEDIPTLTRLEEEFGLTKLHLACFLSDAKAVENSLKHGTNVNAKVNSNSPVWRGFAPLHFVVRRVGSCYRKKEVSDAAIKNIRLLMKHGADPLLVDCNSDTVFHEIERCDRYDFARSALLASMFECIVNYNVNPANNRGFSVFHVACMAHNEVAVERLLKSGVDVNQAISGFSNCLPGKTSLHLLIEHHRDWTHLPCTDASENETFLRILMTLLGHGADVNAKDAVGKTPLFEALRLGSSRRTVIEILIRNGADVLATIMPGNDTPFELLLRLGDASWEEIELFLKAGCKLNAFNPATKEGYMAEVFRYQRRNTFATDDIMENQVFNRILNDPKVAEINDAGRTAVHNVVSINYVDVSADVRIIKRGKYRSQKFRFWLTPRQKAKRRAQSIYKRTTTYQKFYPDLIEQLCFRGCDIDHEDNEGKTALHLAVAFENSRAVVSLLKMGADINITDKNGKTAFAYCSDVSSSNHDSWSDFRGAIVYDDVNYLNKVLTVHAYKLEFCGQRVDKQNRILQGKTLNILGPIPGNFLNDFHDEMEASKNVKIGATSFSVYDFLMSADTDFVYMSMVSEEREQMEKFFENIGRHKFDEIDGLLRLKFRQSIERRKLIEPALESLSLLIKFEIPDLCGRYILKFLKNEDLKLLIASVA